MNFNINIGLYSDLFPIIRDYGAWGIILIFLLIWIFFPEKVERWALTLEKIFAYVSEKHERRYIAKNIESKINDKFNKINKESGTVFSYRVKVEWINVDNLESYLDKANFLIIKMKNHRNQSKNLAVAVKEAVPKSLLPDARIYVHPILMKSLDYIISKKILQNDTVALSDFKSYYKEEFERSKNMKELVTELDTIDSQGFLTRILLSELKKLGYLYPAEPKSDQHEETIKFEKMIYRLVTKKPDEKVNPNMLGQFIRVAVVPIAKDTTVVLGGLDVHINFIRKSIETGISTFYLVAAGETNCRLAEIIANKCIKVLGMKKINEEKYKGFYRGVKMKLYLSVLTVEEIG